MVEILKFLSEAIRKVIWIALAEYFFSISLWIHAIIKP